MMELESKPTKEHVYKIIRRVESKYLDEDHQ
jgi:hypothetical protein